MEVSAILPLADWSSTISNIIIINLKKKHQNQIILVPIFKFFFDLLLVEKLAMVLVRTIVNSKLLRNNQNVSSQ